MKYKWMVVSHETTKVWDRGKEIEVPDVQAGVVDTFAQATEALSAWQGAEDDPPHQLYQIVPVYNS